MCVSRLERIREIIGNKHAMQPLGGWPYPELLISEAEVRATKALLYDSQGNPELG